MSPKEKFKIASDNKLCYVCLKKGHVTRDCATEYKCAKCGARHNVYLCSNPKGTRPSGKVNFVKEDFEPSDYNHSIHEVYHQESDSESDGQVMNIFGKSVSTLFSLMFSVNDVDMIELLDTGATVCMLPSSLVLPLGLEKYPLSKRLDTAKGTLKVDWAVKVHMSLGELIYELEFLLYVTRPHVLLSIEVFKKF